MLAGKSNHWAWTFALVLVSGCAGGEDVATETGGAAGSSAPPWMSLGGSMVGSGGGGTTPTGTGGMAGGSGANLSGGSGGATGGSGGATYISPLNGGAGGNAATGGSGGAPNVDAAAGCGRAGAEGSPVTDAGLTLQYRNQDGGATGSAIQFDLELSTSLTAGVSLNDVEIRYYFTSEIADPLVTEMYWAGTNTDTLTSAVTTTVVPMPAVPGADAYVSFTLPSSTATIAPGNVLTIKPALHKAGYSASFNQCNDYSYEPSRDFAPSTRIAVLVKGALVWGSVPAAPTPLDGSVADGPGDASADHASPDSGDADAPDAPAE
jgi:Cellulose binding domain